MALGRLMAPHLEKGASKALTHISGIKPELPIWILPKPLILSPSFQVGRNAKLDHAARVIIVTGTSE